MYHISVTSSFTEHWRYNFILMCEGLDAQGLSLYVSSQKDIIAEVGENLTAPPAEYGQKRTITLEADDAQSIKLYVYIVPHTLPIAKVVDKYQPFDIEISISRDSKQIYAREHQINQWSGASLEIKA